MSELVIVVSVGKGTWDYLKKLIQAGEWSKIIVIGGKSDLEAFSTSQSLQKICIDNSQRMPELVDIIKKGLLEHISDTEIALNMISGTGKEHMAVLSACLKSGLGIRLVAYSQEKFIEI